MMLGEQERRLAARGFDDAAGKVERSKGGDHLLFQIGTQFGAARRILAFGLEGDAAVEFSEERAGFEILTGAGDGVGSGHGWFFEALGRRTLPETGSPSKVAGTWTVLGVLL
ncbi:hypothetical protein ACVWXN_009728 [Bradyrhizobium sp. i1.4.4]